MWQQLKDKLSNQKALYFFVIISIIFGFVLRYLTAVSSDLFRDEAFTGILIQRSIIEIIQVTIKDGNAILQPILLHLFTDLVGVSDVNIRLFSFIVTIPGILFAYLIGRSYIKSKKQILFFMILVFLSPTLIYYSVEARYYGLLTTEFLACIYLCIKIYDQKSKSLIYRILLGILLAMGLYTHNLFLIVEGGIFVSLVILNHLQKVKLTQYLDIKYSLNFLVPFIISTVLYIPWMFVIFSQAKQITSSFWLTFDPLTSLPVTIANMFTAFYSSNNEVNLVFIFVSLSLVVVCLFFVFSLIQNLKVKNYIAIVTFLILSLYYFVSFKQPILYVRYISFLVPLLLVIYTLGLNLVSKYKYFFAILIILLFIVFDFTYAFPKRDNNLYMQPVANFALSNCQIDCKIINQDALTYFNFEFYTNQQLNSLIYDKILSTPSYIGTALIPKTSFVQNFQDLNTDTIYYLAQGAVNKEASEEFAKSGYTQISIIDFETNLTFYEYKKL